MGWDDPPDKSPPIQEPENPVGKRKKSRKAFAIERRYVGKVTRMFFENLREWHTYRRYRDEKSRDEALRALSRPGRTGGYHMRYEYRVAEAK